jgi:hypothetical protein
MKFAHLVVMLLSPPSNKQQLALPSPSPSALPHAANRMQTRNTSPSPCWHEPPEEPSTPAHPRILPLSLNRYGIVQVKQQIGKEQLQTTCISLIPSVNYSTSGLPSRRRLLQVQHVHARALKATDTTSGDSALGDKVRTSSASGKDMHGPSSSDILARWP